jgi:hypothetical protein
MKRFLCVVAILCLATTGCTTNRMMSPHNGQTGLLTPRAPRPMNQRHMQSEVVQASFGGNVGCDPGCGCDVCCEPTCGDPGCGCEVCCEPTCGDPGCGCDPGCGYDPGCGVDDPCCTDTCTGTGCSSGRGLFAKLFGNKGRNGSGSGNGYRNGRGGLANGGICRACGDPNCPGCLGGGAFCNNIATGFCPHAGGYPEYPNFNQGPPTGQVAYPYYTTRGPRDFLRNNPPSIGPY